MKTVKCRALIIGTALGFLMLLILVCLQQRCEAQRVRSGRSDMTPASRSVIAEVGGIPTMLHDGAPFLIVGAQCDIWRSTYQDAKTIGFFDGFKEMNATTVSVGVPWAKIEPEENKYDFSFMDWFIRQAESRQLKLVINLFDTNVCGGVEESDGVTSYPIFTPKYILSNPVKYQRMVFHTKYTYSPCGPPMCPNDPDTFDRERRLVIQVAKHLKKADIHRTVIMLQVDNEFYYQQWAGARPPYQSDEEKTIRCECPYCNARYDPAKYKTCEEFMFRGFADYVKGLTDAISKVYDIPLYVNSPWWQPYVISMFLDRCPNLDVVGIDGVATTCEPNILTVSQVGRNIPFAAENPTEVTGTRYNLGVLPYYTIVGRQGIGNLLWECGPPRTIVDDKDARLKYGNALYPLKNAMTPIGRARGTDRFIGWYKMFDLNPDAIMDSSGKFESGDKLSTILRKQSLFIREGRITRVIDEGSFEVTTGGVHIAVSGSDAGIIVRTGPTELLIAVPGGKLTITGVHDVRAEEGRYAVDRWVRDKDCPVIISGDTATVDVREPRVIKLSYKFVGNH